MARKRIPIADRFWRRVCKTENCWIWTASTNKDGYGQIKHISPHTGQPLRLAHRVSWELHYGAIPDGMKILHRCDNPPCVRPDHLYVGTMADNMRDMADRKRGAGGNYRLTPDQVREIRALSATVNQRKLAEKYGVTLGHINKIANRHKWPNLPQLLHFFFFEEGTNDPVSPSQWV